jgi:ribosomal-protein-alanine N-acetyltransferase
MEIRPIGPEDIEPLTKFFYLLAQYDLTKFFHPHPLTARHARVIANYSGKDLYIGVIEGRNILGYGLLRGWDSGYKIPSLGIVIHPAAQGQGVGRLLMNFLHVTALRRGANKVRLRVYPDNQSAIGLYRAMGYKLTPEGDRANLIGTLTLRDQRKARILNRAKVDQRS